MVWVAMLHPSSLGPLALLLAGLISAALFPAPEPEPVERVEVTAVTPSRPSREVLVPRTEPWRTSLRALSVRGRELHLGQGSLEGATADGAVRPFTLKHTKVDIEVEGFVQAVTVTQTFENPFALAVEALYAFPLPENAAVHGLTLVVGSRTLQGVVQRREVARQRYEQAKAEGRHAALLDQERPNLFTQSLANLRPGEAVQVSLRYVAPLRFDDGVYTLNFPMVVGPRYVPGAPLAGLSLGSGLTPDTDAVPDASRITPPAARSGRDLELSVRLNAGTVIEDLWSVSHQLEVERASSGEVALALDSLDTLPNKDLVVRWRVSGDEARASVLAGGGAFALMLNPEQRGAASPVTPRELVFLVDTSGSMSGAPLAAAKRAMELALRQLQPLDTFMLIDFAERANAFHEAPLPATPQHVAGALAYLAKLPAAGGTNQLAGLRRALRRPEDPARLRMVLLMTDGFIGNEDQVFAEARESRGNARLFGFGVGSSVNHHLLSRLSEEGRGFYQYVRPDEDATEAVTRFARRLARPLITDVSIDWGGLQVADTLPGPVPDLFDAQPLIIHGRYRAAGAGTVTLRGKRGGVPVVFEVAVTLPPVESPGRALQLAWARQRIEQLSMQQPRRESPELVAQLTALGLEHQLATKYTSLVVVDDAQRVVGPSMTVFEPTLTADLSGAARAFGAPLGLGGSGLGGGFGFGGLGLRGTGAGGGGGAKSPFRPAELGTLGMVGTGGFGAGRIITGKAQVTGARSLESVDRVLRMYRAQLQYCVEHQLLTDPGLTGPLVFQWSVQPDGSTTDVKVLTRALEHSAAARCIASRIRTWQFPPHAGGPVQVRLPLSF